MRAVLCCSHRFSRPSHAASTGLAVAVGDRQRAGGDGEADGGAKYTEFRPSQGCQLELARYDHIHGRVDESVPA